MWNARQRRNLALVPSAIALGLLSRRVGSSAVVPEFAGDVLWGALFYVLFAVLRPNMPQARVWVWAVLSTEAIELTQLYRAPWVVRLRATAIGGLLLGHGFSWSDVLCVALGATLAAQLDRHWSSASECARPTRRLALVARLRELNGTAWLLLAVNVVGASIAAWAALLVAPSLVPAASNPLGTSDLHGPGDGLAMLFVTLPVVCCLSLDIVALLGVTVVNPPQRRPIYACMWAIALTWLCFGLFLTLAA